MSVNEEDIDVKLDFSKDIFDKEVQDLTNKLVPIIIQEFENERNITCTLTILTILNVLLKEANDINISNLIRDGIFIPSGDD